ncbi:MAG TPA: hypothetical protein VK027_07115 [Chitinophagaceae bacterium]|nr:hypothetical protein [Chitinophagaceae bacterium]
MKKLLTLTGISLVLLASCKKIEGDNKNLDPDNETVEEMMSTNPNSFWEYESNENDHFIRKPTGTKQMMNEREWDFYEATDQNTDWITPEYFAKNKDKYVMLLDLEGSQQEYIEVIVYKENPKVGDKFNNTHKMSVSGINVDLLIESEVISINETFNYPNGTIEDVTVIKNKLKGKTGITPYIDCGSAYLYFKKGIGILKMDIDISILSFYNREYTDTLLDYYIEEDENEE